VPRAQRDGSLRPYSRLSRPIKKTEATLLKDLAQAISRRLLGSVPSGVMWGFWWAK
jgi:hypothetical protein